MIIKTLTAGAFQVNNYIVICEKTKEAVLIDVGGEYQATIDILKQNNAELKYIFNTHAHLDHIAGDAEFQNKNNTKVLMHKEDEFLVDSFQEHLAMYGMPAYDTPSIDEFIEDGQELCVGELKFKVIHTPGHSPGGVCFLIEDTLFSGDTLFANSVGRTDLPKGSFEELQNSVKNSLFTLDENITVYPGHGPSTTIKNEKENNPFFGEKVKN